jgi:hypothetical protein
VCFVSWAALKLAHRGRHRPSPEGCHKRDSAQRPTSIPRTTIVIWCDPWCAGRRRGAGYTTAWDHAVQQTPIEALPASVAPSIFRDKNRRRTGKSQSKQQVAGRNGHRTARRLCRGYSSHPCSASLADARVWSVTSVGPPTCAPVRYSTVERMGWRTPPVFIPPAGARFLMPVTRTH